MVKPFRLLLLPYIGDQSRVDAFCDKTIPLWLILLRCCNKRELVGVLTWIR